MGLFLCVSFVKAGIIEEMLDDTMEGLDDQEGLEEEAEEEVDKVLWELTAGEPCMSMLEQSTYVIAGSSFFLYI